MGRKESNQTNKQTMIYQFKCHDKGNVTYLKIYSNSPRVPYVKGSGKNEKLSKHRYVAGQGLLRELRGQMSGNGCLSGKKVDI